MPVATAPRRGPASTSARPTMARRHGAHAWFRTVRRHSRARDHRPGWPLRASRRRTPAPSSLDPERTQHAACLGAGLVELALRIGIGDDPRAGAEAKPATTGKVILEFGAADQDIEVHVAVAVDPADRARVVAP